MSMLNDHDARETGHASKADAPDEARAGMDILQMLFWTSLLVAVAAASVAIAWPEAVGSTGPILLIAMAAGGMVFLLWVLRGAGRRLGLFPDRGSAAAATAPQVPRFQWIEALDEAVLVSDRSGTPIAANSAYGELTELALTHLDDDSAVSVDRLFSASPTVSAPIYRLGKAARAGTARREVLPPITIGRDGVPAQFEMAVSPLPRARCLWRLRRIAGNEEATGAADLRSLYVEDAPMGFFAARPDGRVTYVNGWLRELLGLPEQLQEVRLDDIMRPEFVKLLSRDKKTGQPGRADIMVRGRDGVEVPVQAITTWSGKGASAHGRTVLMPNAHTFSGTDSRPPRPDGSDPMFDDAPFGAVRLDGDSVEGAVILDSNRALMGLTEGRAMPGARFAELFAAEDGPDGLTGKLLEAIDKPMPLKLDGLTPTRHVSVFVTLDAQGRPSVAYIIDMTEQKELELRLAQGEKMQAIGQLAGGVAHDFNNVLTGIMLNTDTLVTRHPVGDPSFDNLKSIHEFAVRARDLVRMLLAYARQQTFKSEVLNVTDFLGEFSILLGQILDERITLEVKHGRDLPNIRADKNQIETAIINLAANARDAMLADGSGGRLSIRTSTATGKEAHELGFNYVEDGDYLLIVVEDDGCGMPPEVMDKIFQPFFTTKEVGVGTGLGLSTVYGIIKQSGGFICPKSEVGKGTSFYIYLPALSADEFPQEDEETLESTAHMRPVDMSGRGRILLVEDEDGVRGIAAQLLESRGYEVEQACDGEDAMEILTESPESFDLVISDVVMPGMDGPTLIREAKELLGDARIIFISGYAERDVAGQIDEDRHVSFLPKPFTVKTLAERVKNELGQRKEKGDKEAA
jgi:two-component system, cell cycle sensor histidine kinase and response regulator CckA